jgi:hypothetical protein
MKVFRESIPLASQVREASPSASGSAPGIARRQGAQPLDPAAQSGSRTQVQSPVGGAAAQFPGLPLKRGANAATSASSSPSTGRDGTEPAKCSMAPRTAAPLSLRNAGLALLAASVPVAAAARTKADPASWVPAPGGPQYPDPVFDHRVQKGNCYSYGRNDPWHGPLAPGMIPDMAEGKIPSSLMGRLAYIASAFTMQCEDLQEGQRRDGAVDPVKEDGCNSVCPDGHHLVNGRVARNLNLGFTEITDFHAVRRNQDGKWTHKMGTGPVSNRDASGNEIDCPDDADFKYGTISNYEDCGYLCHPEPKKLEPGKPREQEESDPTSNETSWGDYLTYAAAAAGTFVAANAVLNRIDPAPGPAVAAGGQPATGDRPAAAAATPRFHSEVDRQVYGQLQSAEGLSRTGLKRKLKGVIGRDVEPALARLEDQGLIGSRRDPDGNIRFAAVA